MNLISKLTWFAILVSIVLLIPLILNNQFFLSIAYTITLVLIISILIQLEKQRRLLDEIKAKIEGLDLKSLNETKKLVNEFSTELKLDQYKAEQEKKYREISKKILELESKMNEKFDLLGKAILKINKEKQK